MSKPIIIALSEKQAFAMLDALEYAAQDHDHYVESGFFDEDFADDPEGHASYLGLTDVWYEIETKILEARNDSA